MLDYQKKKKGIIAVYSGSTKVGEIRTIKNKGYQFQAKGSDNKSKIFKTFLDVKQSLEG